MNRIAHVLPFPGIGGTEHATLRIARAVAPRGFESVIICLEDTADLRNFFGAAGFPVIHVPAPEPSIRKGYNFLQTSRFLASEFKRLKVELVHCADALAGFHCALAGRLAGLPVLCHVRNRHPEMARRVRFWLRPVTHFAFVSRDTWRRFPLRVTPNRGDVIYDGIDPVAEETLRSSPSIAARIKSELGIPDGMKLVGMVARVTPQKDYETLITAAGDIVKSFPGVRFVIVGDYSSGELNRAYYAKLTELLKQKGLEQFFVFAGYRSNVSDYLASFDISVLSTHQEGLPLVLIEAMAHCQPVIATAVDGIPELIDDGVNGYLVSHEDAATLARKIESLLECADTRERLGRAARNTVEQRFTKTRFADSIIQLYRKLLV